MDSGQVYTLATSTTPITRPTAWRRTSKAGIIGWLNGNDTVALLRSNGVSDIYGQIGAVPGRVGLHQFDRGAQGGRQRSADGVDHVEWTIAAGTNTATPGWHQSLPDAAVSVSGVGLDPFAPKATNPFAITISISRTGRPRI